MNTMKTLATVAVLAAVAYGVYTTLNRNAQSTPVPPPPGGWPEGPPQELPDLAAMAPNLGDPADAGVGGVPPVGAAVGSAGGIAGIPPVEAVGSGSYAGVQPGGQPPAAPPYGIGQAPGSAPGVPSEGPAPTYPAGIGGPTNPATGVPPIGAGADSPAPGLPSSDSAAPPSPYDTSAMPPTGQPEGQAAPPPGEPAHPSARDQFEDLMQAVDRELAAGQLADAHLALSRLYENPSLPVEMQQRVVDLLDQLAGTVIYSREHHLEPAYTVAPGDTLESIARQHDVPATVLARINGIEESQALQSGQQLKVIRGPFSATIDLDEYELTLMLGHRYAGRFAIGVGQDHLQLEGTYSVQQKVVDPPYNGPQGTIPGAAPGNPLGKYYIDLGNYIGIHGTNDALNLHHTSGQGAIRLGDRDIGDLYGILSVGSQVTIRR